MTIHDSDVVILGGGSGGYACAIRAAQLGMAVTLIEADKLGGTCLHRGCIPTKALLHTAEIADVARSAPSFGVRTTFEGIDVGAMQSYKNATVARLASGLKSLLSHNNIVTIEGFGVFSGDRTITVEDGDRYRGSSVVLATGAQARSLPGIELGERIFTSDRALSLDYIPATAIILGGGVIGVEFASAWQSLGCEVTVVEALPRLLPSEDPWSVARLARSFVKRGIHVRTDTRVASATEAPGGVTIKTTDGEILEAEVMLVAIGRSPRTADCGINTQGVALERGFVVTDDRQRTNLENVYAVGDLVAGLQLAHRGFHHGIVAAEVIGGGDSSSTEDQLIPRVVYSTPEIASVGLNEDDARARYGLVTTVNYDLAGNGRSQILGTGGGVKVVRIGDADHPGPVVGVHLVGDRIGELIGEAQIAVTWEAMPDDIAPLIHAHPTQNEALGEAMRVLSGSPLHAHS